MTEVMHSVVSLKNLNKIDTISLTVERTKKFTASQINQLATVINNLITAFNSLIHNQVFNELATFDDGIADFCSEDGDLSKITQVLYGYHSWSVGFSTLLYSNEADVGIDGVSECEFQTIVEQQVNLMLIDIDKYTSLFSALQRNDFYFNEVSYGKIRSDCFGNQNCLSNADSALRLAIESTKNLCLQIIR